MNNNKTFAAFALAALGLLATGCVSDGYRATYRTGYTSGFVATPVYTEGYATGYLFTAETCIVSPMVRLYGRHIQILPGTGNGCWP